MKKLFIILTIFICANAVAQPVMSNALNPIFNKNLVIKDSLTVGDMENDATQNRIMVWDSINMKINYRQVTTLPSGAGATDLSFTGASSPVTLNSSTGTDVTITAGTGISLSATGSDLTITSTSTPSLTATYVGYGDGSNLLTGEAAFTYDAVTNNRLTVDQYNMPTTTSGGVGVFYQNGVRLFHTGIGALTNRNIFVGTFAGNLTMSPSGNGFNSGIGYGALISLTTGQRNTALGNESGVNITIGNNNTVIGADAGKVALGDNNTILGAYVNGTASMSNKLWIDGASSTLSSRPLIEGDFAADSLRINGLLKVRDVSLYNTDTVLTWNPLTKVIGYKLSSGGGGTIQDLSYDAANHEIDISGGGTSATIPLAVADGSTLGLSTYTASDFNDVSGVISLDYTNGQAASGSLKGYLTSSDWTVFNTVNQPNERILFGTGAGASSSLKFTYGSNTLTLLGTGATNKTTLNGDDIIITTDVTDDKVFQVKNDISPLGIITAFTDNYKNGGFSVDSSDGTTIVKLRGGATSHTYFNNKFVSVGRGGESVNHGGFIHGAGLTIENGTWKRNAATDYSNPDNYMQIISDDNTTNRELGLGWSVSASSETNVGAALVFKATDVFSKGKLTGYIKTSNVDAVAPVPVFTMDDDGSFDVSNELNVGNDFAINTDGKISEYGNSTPALGEVLVGDGTSFKKKFVPWMMSPQEGWWAYSEMNGITNGNKGAMDMWLSSATSGLNSVVEATAASGGKAGAVFTGTSTSTSGRGQIYSDDQGIYINDGVMVTEGGIYVLDSATATEDYDLYFGFTRDITAPTVTGGGKRAMLFRYSRASIPSRKWECVIVNGASITTYNTGVQFDEDIEYHLRIEVNPGVEIKFYIDGTLVYTETSVLPTSTIGMGACIIKTAGTTSRNLYTDYWWAWQRWYTPQTSRGLFESIAGY